MTDKVQKIKKEIERQIEEGKVKCQQSQENNDYESFVAWSEHVATCGKLLVFINSLQEETKSKDLKEEIERRFNDNMKASEQYTENSKSRALFTSAAKEDYDLLAFIDSLPEESASEDLEEAAKEYSFNIPTQLEVDSVWKKETEQHFKDGAKWQKQQMMKDALDGCVTLIVKSDTSSRNLFISTSQLYKELQKYEEGDKLKIIIVKED